MSSTTDYIGARRSSTSVVNTNRRGGGAPRLEFPIKKGENERHRENLPRRNICRNQYISVAPIFGARVPK